MTQPAVVTTTGLTKRFGRQVAVDDVSLDVRSGDIYGFLGLNGAGKTTTLRLILGLIRPTAGEVALFGEKGRRGRLHAKARLGAMVENPAFYGHLTGTQNLRLLGSLSGPVRRGRVTEVLEQVGLADAAGKRARDYSLGMKQRLAIGLALVSDPELVILDEPTNGLDPNGIIEMRRLIRRLNREHGVTFVISSHLLHEIEMVCTRVAILENGRLVLQKALAELESSLVRRLALRAEPVEEARRVLGETNGVSDVEQTRGLLRFRLAAERLPDLHRALAAAGVSVFTLAEEKMTLEEYFLSLSGAHRTGVLT